MKLIINTLIMRLLGASSVDAIMAGFNRTIAKLDALAEHEIAVAEACEQKAIKLQSLVEQAEAGADAASERAWAAEAKALRLRELVG